MALNPADIATVSRLLDDALALAPAEREAWLAALPPEHQRHAEALRDMLAQAAQLDTDSRLQTMPRLASDDAVAQTGDRIGPYRLLNEIGRGGMGSVWLAERADGAYQRQVALKLPRLAWGAGLAERMAREREIGMLLEHPNIARLYDAGVDERGRPFLALEFIDGQPIDAWCDAQGLGVRERLRLFVQVVKAVAYAHGRLVVHRDLKPSNVLVTPDGQAHLLDFGIAKLLLEVAPGDSGLTQEQGRVLTPHYASPEQVAGEAITVQSDVYSLGVLLYELQTGTLPIAPKRGTLGAVEDAILEGDAPLASSRVKDRVTAKALRGEVDAILAKAMQREPGRRYATADALALDIERHLNGETVMARPDSWGYRSRKSLQRHWVGILAVSAIMMAVLTGSGVAIVQARQASKAAERQRLATAFVADVFRINHRPSHEPRITSDLTGDRLLAEGAVMIAQRFPGEPEMQAELYGVVSELFLEMSAADPAVDYATRQVEALELAKADKLARAIAINRVANAMLLKGRFADGESRARFAAELSGGVAAVEIESLGTQARALIFLGDYERCELTLNRIAELAKRLGRETVGEAWSHAARGSMLAGQNRYRESGQHYERGIEMALRIEGPLSLAAIGMRGLRANQMLAHGEGREAMPIVEAAVSALRTRGGASAIRAEIFASGFAQEFAGGELYAYPKAMQIIEHANEYLSAHPTAPSHALARVRFDRGMVMLMSGRVHDGYTELKSVASQVLSVSDSPFIRFGFAGGLAIAAIRAGDLEAASAWSQESIGYRRAMGEERHPYAIYDHTMSATIEAQRGRFDEALAILDRTPRFAQLAAGGGESDLSTIAWARAAVLAQRGEPEAALNLVSGLDLGWDVSRVELLVSLKCAVGQPGDGRSLLEGLASKRAAVEYAHSPEIASLRANAGLCALASGDRRGASLLATQARAAFNAQPKVSTHYKAPLFKLERALGLRLPPV